jgi:hypothetical protein
MLRKHHSAYARARVVNICPGWVGTQIAKDDAFASYLLNFFGFPSEGWGIASALHAIFSPEDGDFYINSLVFDTFSVVFDFLPASQVLRDWVTTALAFGVVMFVQGFFPNVSASRSSPESYNETIAESLYRWSYAAIEDYT